MIGVRPVRYKQRPLPYPLCSGGHVGSIPGKTVQNDDSTPSREDSRERGRLDEQHDPNPTPSWLSHLPYRQRSSNFSSPRPDFCKTRGHFLRRSLTDPAPKPPIDVTISLARAELFLEWEEGAGSAHDVALIRKTSVPDVDVHAETGDTAHELPTSPLQGYRSLRRVHCDTRSELGLNQCTTDVEALNR